MDRLILLLAAAVSSVFGGGLQTAPRDGAVETAQTGNEGCPLVRFGVVTDCHYAERMPNFQLNRHYRVAKEKLAACVDKMNELKPDFLIELGDFKDAGRDETETLRFLDEIEGVFAGFRGPRHHVLGNHDADRISKAQFLAHVTNTGFAAARAEYSFETKGVKFIVLDGNFNADGTPYDHGNFDWRVSNVSAAGLAFLRREIGSAKGPIIVFCHQRLDVDDHYATRNAAEVRRILEASGGKVKAVFTGHHHSGGESVVRGIPYYSIKAVIEGGRLTDNAFALVEMAADGRVFVCRLDGRCDLPAGKAFDKTKGTKWGKQCSSQGKVLSNE